MVGILDLERLKNEPQELQDIFKSFFLKGKNIRSQVVHCVGSSIALDTESIIFVSRIVEYVHSSSLLHDDVLDHSKERRSYPSAWLQYSPAQAVLAGDYLLVEAMTYIIEKGSFSLMKQVTKTLKDLITGEFLQRETIQKKNEDLDKINIISNLKTSSIFKLCLIVPFLLSRKNINQDLEQILNSIGHDLGVLFQRSDDLLDFSIRNKEKKSILTDLNQGYLNSFSCFLLSDKDEKTKNKFREIRKLEDVYRVVEDFEDKLKKFDEMNDRFIHQLENKIQSIDSFLLPTEKDVIKCLKKFPRYLYYRDVSKV